MDIELIIRVVLKDNHWGFSELLDGRSLTDETREDIKQLILEDVTEVIYGEWTIKEAKQ